MRIEFDQYFMAMAKLAAARSGCNSRPTGAVIVKNNRIIATGYNGTIAGQKQCTDFDDDFCLHRAKKDNDTGMHKYLECPSIHAEQNAINQIAKYGGIPLRDATIYCTLFPCIYCLKNIASVGINTIYYELEYISNDPDRDQYWQKQADLYNLYTSAIELKEETCLIIENTMKSITSHRRL